MDAHRRGTKAIAAGLLAATAGTWAVAADVEKRFRISLAVGGFDTQDAVPSDSANTFVLTDDDDRIISVLQDPRNDSAVFNELKIKPATRATIAAQYAVTKTFIVEGSVGYQKGDVGDIEMQAQFTGVPIPEEVDFAFSIFQIPAGEMEQIPIQLTAIGRYRQRTSFNPYLGFGVGYTVVGFEPSAEFNELSRNLDDSVGTFAPRSTSVGSTGAQDLVGASVDARDTFGWHLVGGAELQFKKKWVLFADLRYSWSSREMSIGFNDSDSLGISLPDGREFASEVEEPIFGSVFISEGGLVDAGRLVPEPGAPASTDCSLAPAPAECEFVFDPDGQLDTGFYYVQGGSVDYGGVSLQLGVRYTF